MATDTLTIQLVNDMNREAVIALTVNSDQARFIETNAESIREMETGVKYARGGFVDSGLIDEWNGEEIWVYHIKQGQPS